MKQFIFFFSLSIIIFAQENLMELSLEELLNIKVEIGTRGEERSAFNSPVPIDVITKEEIMATGLPDLQSVIQRIIPSFNSPRHSIADGTDHLQPFTLRGLAPDQVLVLINGKRKVTSSIIHLVDCIGKGSTSNDLNSIPITTIERIEILRDGAAAQYGSDAIAGIINIVLKQKSGNELTYQYAQTSKNDGKTNIVNAQLGTVKTSDDFYFFNIEFRDRDRTNRSNTVNDRTGRDAILNGQKLYRLGDADARDINFTYNFQKNFEQYSLYSFGYLNNRIGEAGGFYRFPSQKRTLIKVYPNGFLPLIAPNIMEYNYVIGAKTNILDWNADFSINTGKNSFEFNVKNSINGSLGPTSPREFYCGTLEYKHTIFNIDLNRQINLGFEKPATLAFGFEYRIENFVIKKGEEASYIDGGYIDTVDGIERKYPAGAQVFPGFMPDNETDKSKNNFSFYGDIEQNILSNLLLGLAIRYENFSDFGETTNGKISLRYELIEKFVIRTSASTGFKAPTLQQMYFTSTATNNVSGTLYQVGTFPVNHPLSKELGAKPLKPEKSQHFSFGFASQNITNLNLSVDYFFTAIKDRIVLSGDFADDPSISSAYVRNLLQQYKIGAARFFTNAVDTKTQGIDFVAKYNISLNDYGLLLTSLSLNYNKTEIDGDIKVPSEISDPTSKNTFFDRMEVTRITKAQPQMNIIFNTNYRFSNFETNLRVIKYGDVDYVQDVSNPSLDQTYKGKIIVDLDFGYSINNNIKINVGAQNLNDSYPDKVKGSSYLPYFGTMPFGFNGRTIYGKLAIKL